MRGSSPRTTTTERSSRSPTAFETLLAPPSPLHSRPMSDDPKRRPTVTLQPGRHKRAASGHPWVYSNEVVMDAAAKALPPGTLVTLRQAGGEPLGVASFNPHTLVSARVIERDIK